MKKNNFEQYFDHSAKIYYTGKKFPSTVALNKLKVVLTEEAQDFLDAQPFKAQQKIYYNIFKVEEGVMKVDIF